MTSIGTGYDLSVTTYSPDGRIFQVEYANKAVENSGTVVGLRCKDGVVFGVEKLISSQLLEPGTNRRVGAADYHIGLASAGLLADVRSLAGRARQEAEGYKQNYHGDIPVRVLAERVAAYCQAYTLYGSVRPFGCAMLLGGVDLNGPQLYMIEPSGVVYGYYGVAVGKATAAAKTEIEKLKLTEMTARQAVFEVAKIIYRVHDEVKDKLFELELGWVCAESGNRFQLVPKDLFEQAEAAAKQALEADEEMQE